MTKKTLPLLFSVVLACVLLLSVTAQAAETEKTVGDAASFMAALDNANVSKIILANDIRLERPGAAGTPGGDASLMIPKHTNGLVIEGNRHELTVHNGGIILGGNTTFQNLSLTLTSFVRNGIMANGHTLTLENVKNIQSQRLSIHLFCGTMLDYNGTTNQVPTSGTHGKIILKGNNEIGQIFAGNLRDRGSSQTTPWAHPSTITVEQTGGTIGTIFGCGASESTVNGEGDVVSGTHQSHPVTGNVTIQLGSPSVPKPKTVMINGAASNTNAAKVSLYLDGNMHTPKLDNISALELNSGYFCAERGLSFASYADSPKKITLAQGTKMDISSVTEPSPLLIGSLDSQDGMLILGQNQQVSFSDSVTGTTQVAIGGVTAQGGSSKLPNKKNMYLKAPTSTAKNAFRLLPYNGSTDVLQPNEKGEWFVGKAGETTPQIVLPKFELGAPQITGNIVTIPVTTGLAPDNIDTFTALPYHLLVAGKSISPIADNSCTFTITNTAGQSAELHFSLELMDSDSQDQLPCLWIEFTNADSVPAGTYTFTMQIDKKYIQGATTLTSHTISFTIPAAPSSGYSLGELTYGTSKDPLSSNAVLPREILDLEVSLTGENGKPVSVFVTAYDQNGRMLSSAIQSGTISANTLTLKLTGALDNRNGKIAAVKAFLMDAHNAPLCGAKSVDGLR